MADGSIDNLNIQISADSNRAVKALNNLSNTLNKVNKAFNGMNTKGVSSFSANVNKLASSLRSLDGIKFNASGLASISKGISSLSKIDYSKISSGIQPIRELSGALKSLQGIDSVSIPKIEAKNINSVISAAKKISEVDMSKMPQVADGMKKISDSMSVLASVKFTDSGLNKVVNALNRLFQADFSKFNPEAFQKITQSISALGDMPDISTSINRFVSSLARLASAGDKTNIVANSLPRLSTALNQMLSGLSGAASISPVINDVVASIAKLASAGSKTSQTASGLKDLSSETLKFFQAMQNAPKISSNTLRMTEALARLASSGSKVRSATSGLNTAFEKLSNVSSKTASVVKRAASSIVSAISQIGNSGSKIDKVSIGLGSLLSGALIYRGIGALGSFTKNALDLGSSMVEVQNVVDVAFGDMAEYANQFASTATEQFGLSELAAKQYSGTMMAMLNSSGVAQEAAAEMSTTLTGLAGDLASFYNISTDLAWEKIRAGIAGETEPLRQLGINMTVKLLLRLYTAMYIESLRERMQKRCAA